jgi:hypothetical protein
LHRRLVVNVLVHYNAKSIQVLGIDPNHYE